MNQDEIKREIDCKSACRAALVGFAEDFDNEIVELEAQLVEAEKPELRNWEIGVDDFQRWIKINGHIYWIHDRDSIDLGCPSECEDATFLDSPRTNILDVLDDLKAVAEPLRTFKLSETHISGSLSGSLICLRDRDEQSSLPLAKVRELVVYLQRLVFTAGMGGSGE